MVQSLGVTLGQGYLLARPAAAEAWNEPAIEDVRSVAPTRARRRIDVASVAGPGADPTGRPSPIPFRNLPGGRATRVQTPVHGDDSEVGPPAESSGARGPRRT